MRELSPSYQPILLQETCEIGIEQRLCEDRAQRLSFSVLMFPLAMEAGYESDENNELH